MSGSVRGAQRLVDVLQANGVRYIFGIPGAKVDSVFDVLNDGGPELIVCRHEQNAAFMAGAVGRLTGQPGVVLVTSGPGTTNLVTGLLTANTEQDPLIAICGAVSRADRLKRTHQSMDAAALLEVVTKYTAEVDAAENIAEAVSNAFRAAVTEPQGAAAIVLPDDVGAVLTSAAITKALPVPALGPAPAEQIRRAAELIKGAKYPVVLVGLRGSSPVACSALRRLIGGTDLAVVETFQAAGVISRELEDHYLGRVGLFRNQPGDIVISHADLIITVGYDAVEYDPGRWNNNGERQIVHIDSVPADIDNHYQPAIELRGDIAATVDALAPMLSGLLISDEARTSVALQRRALSEVDELARSEPDMDAGVNPAALVLALRDALDDDATVACDIGSNYVYMARHFRVYQPRHLMFSNGQQTLGVALPWAMAAALVRPGTQIVSVSGDGGFLFSAQELETATRLGLDFTHVILRDNTYDMVGFQQELKYGRRSGVQLGDYDIVHYAAAFGAHGRRVQTMNDFALALKESLAEAGPSIIDVMVDYSCNIDLAQHLHDGQFE